MNLDLPRPNLALAVVTQALLGAMVVVGVSALVFLPVVSGRVATSVPEYADLRPPLLVISMSITALGLVVLAMVSLLVWRVWRGTILRRSSLRWADVIVASLFGGAALVVAMFVVVSNGQAGSPFVGLVQVGVCLVLTVLACVMLVLRSLLRQAILISDELDEVV